MEVSSARELKLKGACQNGREPLHTEAEDAILLNLLPSYVTEDTSLCLRVIYEV
jgi:hypothetical protein